MPGYNGQVKEGNSKYCNCLFFASGALARSLGRLAEEEFSTTGLAPSYAFLLMAVNEKPGIQPGEIAEEMQLAASTVTRLIDKMENRGFVKRKTTGKKANIFPTQKSRDLDAQIKEAWASLYKRYTTLLGESTARKLTTATYEADRILEGRKKV